MRAPGEIGGVGMTLDLGREPGSELSGPEPSSLRLSGHDLGGAELSARRSGPAILRVALPVSAPTPAEDMCLRAGAAVIWTKLSAVASHGGGLPARASSSRPGRKAGYIFPRFLPAYDAVAALAHTFALLASTGPGSRASWRGCRRFSALTKA